MKSEDYLWWSAIGALTAAEIITIRRGKGQFTMTLRRTFRTDTRAGGVLFGAAWTYFVGHKVAKHVVYGGW